MKICVLEGLAYSTVTEIVLQLNTPKVFVLGFLLRILEWGRCEFSVPLGTWNMVNPNILVNLISTVEFYWEVAVEAPCHTSRISVCSNAKLFCLMLKQIISPT